MINTELTGAGSVDYLTSLVYELLDAHQDTTRLAEGAADEESWAAHLDYLRDLQRVGRERLARTERLAA